MTASEPSAYFWMRKHALDTESSKLLAMPNGGEVTDLMAAMHDAVPRLFRELDDLRAEAMLAELSGKRFPILGTVG